MAIYHLHAKTISRNVGQSAVASAAYRAGESLEDERLGKDFDYTKKGGVLHTEIMLPDKAKSWNIGREKLWNMVEKNEKRKDSQLAREIDIALPNEFTLEQNIELTKTFIQENFVDKGMIADFAIHEPTAKDKAENKHAHIMLTMRDIQGEGFGKKNREWNKKELLEVWRENWADNINDALKKNGDNSGTVDHRTLEAQGIERIPQIHVGVHANAMEKKGGISERGEKNREIDNTNRMKMALKSAAHWLKQKHTKMFLKIQHTLENQKHSDFNRIEERGFER